MKLILVLTLSVMIAYSYCEDATNSTSTQNNSILDTTKNSTTIPRPWMLHGTRFPQSRGPSQLPSDVNITDTQKKATELFQSIRSNRFGNRPNSDPSKSAENFANLINSNNATASGSAATLLNSIRMGKFDRKFPPSRFNNTSSAKNTTESQNTSNGVSP